ncbi:hypothetical protein HKX48_008781 [Thoreauomyces humboldtii]|nr:hypothetical protein HKX48_008781 [Thoreauomyces humboldtii]
MDTTLHSTLSTRSFSSLSLASAGACGVAVGILFQRWWNLRHPTPSSQQVRSGPARSKGQRTHASDEASDDHGSEGEGADDSGSSGSSDEDDDEEEEEDGQRHHKMVLVVRTDLGMTKGKMAAQCCHAAVAAVRSARSRYPDLLRRYERYGAAKVALKCSSEKELLDLYRQAKKAGLIAEYIEDAGRTQIPEGSRTVLAVGPGLIPEVDSITGHLKLL